MAGSGRSETTKNCGIVSFLIYLVLFTIMSFILIGVSVKVCVKVNLLMSNICRKNTAYVWMAMNNLSIEVNFMKVAGTGWELVSNLSSFPGCKWPMYGLLPTSLLRILKMIAVELQLDPMTSQHAPKMALGLRSHSQFTIRWGRSSAIRRNFLKNS